jgi:signal transduction histidine kinase
MLSLPPLVGRLRYAVQASLLARLLAILGLGVGAALITVAVVARWSTAVEFQSYVEGNQAEMQAVAHQIAASTGKRLVVENVQGQVVLDSSARSGPPVTNFMYVGKTLSPSDTPGTAYRSGVRVQFLDTGSAPAPPGVPGEFNVTTAGPTLVPPLSSWTAAEQAPEALFIRAFDRSLLIGVLVGGLVAIALAVFFARRILRPVRALTTAAQRLERGDLSQRVTVGSYDEIGRLGQAFNAMAQGLDRTEQLRRTMVADVAHELRTPLTNLQGYLEAVRDGMVKPDAAVVDSLYDEALLLGRLVDDLRDLALSDAGQLTLHREPTPAADLVLPSILAIRPRAVASGIALSASVSDDLPSLQVDRERIGQVMRNLLDNALAHTPSGGWISVSADRVGGSLALNVRDSGAGIDAAHLPFVFERFYRADPSRSRATGGAGIGLAVARELVEAHGGRISVKSVPLAGTTFSVDLPIDPRAAPSMNEKLAPVGQGCPALAATDSPETSSGAKR